MIFKWLKKRNHRGAESGNMILAIFGAVAIVGTLGAGTAIIVNGPVKIMANVNQTSQTQSQLMVASKMILLDVDNQTSGNDCDNDRITEPREWRDAAGLGPDGVAGSSGGGFLPHAIGASKRDAWGTQYGYCVWDHGALIDDAGCLSAGAQNRLAGLNSIDHPVVAIISAGRNGTFETGCLDFAAADTNSDGDINDANEALITPAGDDVVAIYSYAEAAQDNPGLWQLGLNADGESVAILDPTIDSVQFNAPSTTTGSTAFGGNLELLSTAGEIPGMNIPTQAVLPSCDSMMDGEIRVNTEGTQPIAEICKDSGGGFAWTPLGTGGASLSATIANAIADPVFDPRLGNCIKSEGGPLQLISSTPWNATKIMASKDFIFASDGTRVRVYTFDGQNFTMAHDISVGSVNNMWEQNGVLYVGRQNGSPGLVAFDISDDGSLISRTVPNLGNTESIWGRGNYIFAAHNNNIAALYDDGSIISFINDFNFGFNASGIWGNDKYIFASDGDIEAFELNENAINKIAEIDLLNDFGTLTGDMNYLYQSKNSDARAYSFDGATFTQTGAAFLTSGTAQQAYSDGTHLFLHSSSDMGIFKIAPNGSVARIETVPIRGHTSSDGRFIYQAADADGLRAYAGYTCIEAVVPSQKNDYNAQITVEQPADAGTTLDSVGWAQGNDGSTGAGISMTVKSNASGGSLPSASILANGTGGGSETALFFNTRDSDGNFNQKVKITKDGDLKIDGFSDPAVTNIQIGGREETWNTSYEMGLMSVTSDGFDQGGYFGFEGESDASNVILFTDELSIKKTNITGRSLREIIKFEASLATSFFGDLLIKGESVNTALRNNSYSTVAGNGGVIEFKRSRGFRGTEETVADGDILGQITMQAGNGTGLSDNKAQLGVVVDGTVSTGDVPTDLSLTTLNLDFDPKIGNCIANRSGPIEVVGQFDTINNNSIGIITHKGDLIIGDGVPGQDTQIYRLENGQVRLIDSTGSTDVNVNFWEDGNFLYGANNTGGINVYNYDPITLNISLITQFDSSNGPISRILDIWGDGQYLYAIDRNLGQINALTFDGTNLTYITSHALAATSGLGIWGDGTYIYTTTLSGVLQAFSFDGTNFTLLATRSGSGSQVWTDDNYIYTTNGSSGLRALSFNGTAFTLIDTYDTDGEAVAVWGDGTHIYLADRLGGLKIFNFDGTTLTLVDTITSIGSVSNVWGDGQYIYTASSSANGVHILSGFECVTELRLKEAGNVGINKKDPEAKLHIGGRTLSTQGIRIDNDTTCSADEDYGTIRYTGNTADPYEVCTNGSGWVSINLNKPADPILTKCSPLPFDFKDIRGTTASTEYTTNAFIVGGLPDGRSCYLTASSEAAGLTVNLNGTDQTGTIVEVTNGDVVKIEVDSGTGDDCQTTTIALGDKTDQFTVGTGIGCYPNSFFPYEGNCIANNGGPFSVAGFIDTSFARHLIKRQQYLIVADGSAGVRAYTFDGSTFTLIATYDTPGNAQRLWDDGNYIYVADTDNIIALSFNGLSFNLEGLSTSGTNNNDIWSDGEFIYVADGAAGIAAYTFNGTTFALAGSIAVANAAGGISKYNEYIIVGDSTAGISAYSFNGTNFTLIDTYNSPGSATKLWVTQDYIYLDDSGNGVIALTFNGTNFTVAGSDTGFTDVRSVWHDGTHLYVADDSSGVAALTFNGTNFSSEGSFNTPGNAAGIFGDGQYIYVADESNGIIALSGFECLATD